MWRSSGSELLTLSETVICPVVLKRFLSLVFAGQKSIHLGDKKPTDASGCPFSTPYNTLTPSCCHVNGLPGVAWEIMWILTQENWRQPVRDISHQSRWWWSSLYRSQPPLPLLSSWGARSVTWWLILFPPLWKRTAKSQMAADTVWVIKTTQVERFIFTWWLCCVIHLNQETNMHVCTKDTNKHRNFLGSLTTHLSLSHYRAAAAMKSFCCVMCISMWLHCWVSVLFSSVNDTGLMSLTHTVRTTYSWKYFEGECLRKHTGRCVSNLLSKLPT